MRHRRCRRRPTIRPRGSKPTGALLLPRAQSPLSQSARPNLAQPSTRDVARSSVLQPTECIARDACGFCFTSFTCMPGDINGPEEGAVRRTRRLPAGSHARHAQASRERPVCAGPRLTQSPRPLVARSSGRCRASTIPTAASTIPPRTGIIGQHATATLAQIARGRTTTRPITSSCSQPRRQSLLGKDVRHAPRERLPRRLRTIPQASAAPLDARGRAR